MNPEKIPQKEQGEASKELRASVEEEINKKIREGEVDANEIAEIAEGLKNKGLFPAGDELQEEAFKIYRQRLIERELEKKSR